MRQQRAVAFRPAFDGARRACEPADEKQADEK
jgi:hypothetical protein